MLSAFTNSFKIPELRTKILITLGLVFACRFIANVPTPGVDPSALKHMLDSMASSGPGRGLFGLADLFSGGALEQCSVGALGIIPYISATIVLQLMTAVIPALEKLAREGDVGRQKITQYARYMTIAICALQSFGIARMIENPGMFFGSDGGRPIVAMSGVGFELLTMLSMTVGSMMMVWIGEQISQHGVGNGVSLIITVNIVSRLPDAIAAMWTMFRNIGGSASSFSIFHLVWLMGMLFLVIAGTIALTQGQRRVPIHTTKRVVGRKVYAGQNTFMPLRVNYSGVMPIIFASSLLMIPAMVLSKLPFEWAQSIGQAFLSERHGLYIASYALLILFFSYFWVATQFNPIQIADELKRHGGYVPGIRPGRPTAEFMDKTMLRLTLAGSIFLTLIAIVPSILSGYFKIPYMVAQFFGGTSLLIIVGVMLDTMRQIEAHLLMRHYDGFLKKGKLRGRR